MKTLKIETSKV